MGLFNVGIFSLTDQRQFGGMSSKTDLKLTLALGLFMCMTCSELAGGKKDVLERFMQPQMDSVTEERIKGSRNHRRS